MYQEKYLEWLNEKTIDENTKNILKNMSEDEKRESFYKDLSFGTGGLRGILGVGTNRMNIYTVRKATQGLANFINNKNMAERGVAIAYDSRNMSPEFALETALVLSANGIKTYLYKALRPTPQLSYSVRKLNCAAGVVITASHNPAAYNGYKVYWEDGGQITPPLDSEIIGFVNAVKGFDEIKFMPESEAVKSGLLVMLDEDMDRAYLSEIKKLALRPEAIERQKKNIKIVYTPLHGTGLMPVSTILKEMGFENVYVVEEQAMPDGNFSTVDYPNPEVKNAFKLALELAMKVDADIVLATDPDADRLGVYVKDDEGNYQALTGNLSGALLMEYELSQRKALGKLPENGAVVKTVVTGNMSKEIAAAFGVKLIETLTGFKYIGEQIKWFEENNTYEYLFGYEESYGCLIGTHARDKDAVSAVFGLCEACAYYMDKGISIWQQINNMYEKYGFFMEDIISKTYPGESGEKHIKELMENLRKEPLDMVCGLKVSEVKDYLDYEKTGLPKSNMLYYYLEDGTWFCIRPSGTEPKIKLYAGIKAEDRISGIEKMNKLKEELDVLV